MSWTFSPTFDPSPLAEQIKAIKADIAIKTNVLAARLRRREISDVSMAQQLHPLRSALWTLEKIEAAGIALHAIRPAAPHTSDAASMTAGRLDLSRLTATRGTT